MILFVMCMTVFVWNSLDKNQRIKKTFLDTSNDGEAHKLFYSIRHLRKKTEQIRSWNYKPIIVDGVNCKALFKGKNDSEITDLNNYTEKITEEQYVYMTKDCSNFKNERSYITTSLTSEEKLFPIAYAIVVYKEICQVEKLLRAIYRPQNVYCFHVDNKSKTEFRQSLTAIVDCFPNVFISKISVDVRWGKYSLLETQLICMKELMFYKKWKYFINLAGQEFPLKTNYEIVQILKAYNGTNDIKCPRYVDHSF